MVRGKFFLIGIVAAAIVLLFSGCEDAPPAKHAEVADVPRDIVAEEVTVEPVPAVELPEDFGLTAVYVMGEAALQRSGMSDSLHVGTVLQQGDRILVADDGFVELQSSDGSMINLDAGTEVVLEQLYRDVAVARTQLYMHQGETLIRVNRQRANDRFTLRTRSIIAGVRGTAFAVTAYPDGRSRTAVGSGQVLVLPAEVDVELLYDQAGRNEAALELVEALFDAGIVLFDGQELTIDQDVGHQQLAQQYQQIAQQITQTLVRPGEPLMQEVTQQLQQIRQTAEELLTPRELEESSRQQLQRLEQVALRNLAPAASVQVTITTIPDDARILVNGREEGSGNLRGIYSASTPLSVQVVRTGYQPVEFVPDTRTGGDYTVRLQAAAVQESETEAEAEQPPAAGDEQPERKSEAIEPTDPEPGDILWQSDASGSSPVRRLAAGAEGVITVDREGKLQLLDYDTGQVDWALSTRNDRNENSGPEVIGSSVLFSGAVEMVLSRTSDGRILQRRELGSDSSHAFGQQALPYHEGWIIPADTGVALANPDFSHRDTVAIEEGSAMTPVLHQDSVITVSFNGDVIVISPETAEIQQRITTNATQPVGHAPVIDGGVLFFGDRRGRVSAVSLLDGEKLWVTDLPDNPGLFHDPVVAGGLVVFFGGGELFALQTDSGELLYQMSAAAPAAIYGERLVSIEGSQLKIFAIADGTPKADYFLPAPAASAVPVVWNDSVFAGLQTGSVVRLQLPE